MNIIICDDRIDDRKNVSDLLSDYGEKKNYEFAITEYDSGEQLCEEQSALLFGGVFCIAFSLVLSRYDDG